MLGWGWSEEGTPLYGRGIVFLGFSVSVTFEIVFFGFCTQNPRFSVLVSTAVYGFSLFDIRVSVFMNKTAVIRFL